MTEQAKSALALAGVLLGAIFWIAIFSPLTERIEAAEKVLIQVRNREGEAAVLEKLYDQLQPLLRRSGDINLVTQIDGLMRTGQLKDRVVQMQSQVVKSPTDGSLRPNESAVLRLDRLDLAQLQKALSAMESLARNVWVRTIEIRRQGKNEAMVILEIDELETGGGG